MPSEFEVGHMRNRSGGRERVYVILRCVHGDEDAPKEFLTEHSEYERLHISQRGSVLDEAVHKHREALRDEHGVTCDCILPPEFTVEGAYRARGRS
jgi:hypothetical protein